MTKQMRSSASSLSTRRGRAWQLDLRALVPLLLLLACMIGPGGCTCTADGPPAPRGVIACRPQHPTRATVPISAQGVETASAGALPVTFTTTSTGEASLFMPFRPVPGGPGEDPQVGLTYNSDGGNGVVGQGFSISGASAITRCPSNLARDEKIRGIKYDAQDQLCLDSKRLVVVEKEPGRIEYRTVPDTHMRVLGHNPDENGTPGSFEAYLPSGVVIEYGTSEGTRPRGPGGAPRAWLAAVARDGRGNAMDFGYCFANEVEYTAEYALDEIRYTRFDGSAAFEASRAMKFLYKTKDPADIRTIYSGGMALQSSLLLHEIQMVGPGEELVRRYAFEHSISPTTSRTLLSHVEECAGNGVCKPPTRFQYKSQAPGFKKHKTGILAPTSKKASPLVVDMDGDGLDDIVVPDTDPALSTPGNPITKWLLAHNEGASPFLGSAAVAFSQEWITVENASGPADPGVIQPELGTVLEQCSFASATGPSRRSRCSAH